MKRTGDFPQRTPRWSFPASAMLRIIARACLLWLALAGGATAGEKAAKKAPVPWSPPPYAKVVGYLFKLPGDESTEPKSGFSLLTETGLDAAQLEKLTIKSAELSRAQVQQLAQAMSARKATGAAACYDPHNIYVFYDAAGRPTGAVEVCFGCTGVFAFPELARSQWRHHDFPGLARLTEALGLWPPGRTVAAFEALLKQREKE